MWYQSRRQVQFLEVLHGVLLRLSVQFLIPSAAINAKKGASIEAPDAVSCVRF